MSNNLNYKIRKIKDFELFLLDEFLYQAIFIPEGFSPPPREITKLPELQMYIEDFGTGSGDNCLVAISEDKVVGAVWTRIIKDYGHVDDETPSFSISILKNYRGLGIGRSLMLEMLELLKSQGYKQASLSVQKDNYAYTLYKDLGFEILWEKDSEYIMIYHM